MDTILVDIDNIFVYMDDILVFSNSKEEHLKTLGQVLDRLDKNGMTISLKKCAFGQEQLDFLGYNVSTDGIKPLTKKVQAITDFPAPNKPKQLLGFLGALNYYRRALPKINNKSPAEVLQPLYAAATQKLTTVAFKKLWDTQNLEHSFKQAKELLTKACELAHPDPGAKLALTTDASKKAIGAVLEQFANGSWKPLGFWSKQLKPAEQRWTTFRRELLAVQQAIRHFLPEVD